MTYFSARLKISFLLAAFLASASAAAAAFLEAHASSRLRRLRVVSGTAGCCGGKRWREEVSEGWRGTV